MSRLVHCRRCGAVFVADRLIGLLPPRWRLCPPCRAPLPPTGAIGVRGRQLPILPEPGP